MRHFTLLHQSQVDYYHQTQHWDVLLLPGRVGPLLRWWYRNVAGFCSVALPPRLLGYQVCQVL